MPKRTATQAGMADSGGGRGRSSKKKNKSVAIDEQAHSSQPKPKKGDKYERERRRREKKRSVGMRFGPNGQVLGSGANSIVATPRLQSTDNDTVPSAAGIPAVDSAPPSTSQIKKAEKIFRQGEKAKDKEAKKAMHRRLKAESKKNKRAAILAARAQAGNDAADDTTSIDPSGKAVHAKDPNRKESRKAARREEHLARKAKKAAHRHARKSQEALLIQDASGADPNENQDVSLTVELNGGSYLTTMPNDLGADSAPMDDVPVVPRTDVKEAPEETFDKEKESKSEKKQSPKQKRKPGEGDKQAKDMDGSNGTPVVENGPLQSISDAATSAAPGATSSDRSTDPALSSRPQSEMDEFMAKHSITLTDPLSPTSNPGPIVSFDQLLTFSELSRAPFEKFATPTPIQAVAWPYLFSGRDVVGVAETGSGKTLAFGVPCVRHIMMKAKRKGVMAVIVSPTRELACQIHEQVQSIVGPTGLKSVCIYGGVPRKEQRDGLKTASIVVATPGRLNDLIDQGVAKLSNAGYVVLDEADRMLDTGFEDAIRKIIDSTRRPEKRQTIMFTATWPKSVQGLAATFMRSPVKISIGDSPAGEPRANARISQIVRVVDVKDKERTLFKLLKMHTSGHKKTDRILIFCLYKKEAMRIEESIRRKGYNVAGIHGDLGQAQRTASLEKFKNGEVPLLVATDVAARGLDIPAVKVVINVTFPLTAEDYVHRIGRTGRAGQDGTAITLFTEHDKAMAGALINVLKGADQPVPDELLKFGSTVRKKGHDAYGAFYKDTTSSKAPTKMTFDD